LLFSIKANVEYPEFKGSSN